MATTAVPPWALNAAALRLLALLLLLAWLPGLGFLGHWPTPAPLLSPSQVPVFAAFEPAHAHGAGVSDHAHPIDPHAAERLAQQAHAEHGHGGAGATIMVAVEPALPDSAPLPGILAQEPAGPAPTPPRLNQPPRPPPPR